MATQEKNKAANSLEGISVTIENVTRSRDQHIDLITSGTVALKVGEYTFNYIVEEPVNDKVSVQEDIIAKTFRKLNSNTKFTHERLDALKEIAQNAFLATPVTERVGKAQ